MEANKEETLLLLQRQEQELHVALVFGLQEAHGQLNAVRNLYFIELLECFKRLRPIFAPGGRIDAGLDQMSKTLAHLEHLRQEASKRAAAAEARQRDLEQQSFERAHRERQEAEAAANKRSYAARELKSRKSAERQALKKAGETLASLQRVIRRHGGQLPPRLDAALGSPREMEQNAPDTTSPARPFTLAEVCARWGVTTMTLRRWRRAGRLKIIRLGRCVRVSSAEVERFEREAEQH